MHKSVFGQFSFRWIYYYGSNKFTGKETDKTHLCAVYKANITEQQSVHPKVQLCSFQLVKLESQTAQAFPRTVDEIKTAPRPPNK